MLCAPTVEPAEDRAEACGFCSWIMFTNSATHMSGIGEDLRCFASFCRAAHINLTLSADFLEKLSDDIKLQLFSRSLSTGLILYRSSKALMVLLTTVCDGRALGQSWRVAFRNSWYRASPARSGP